MIEIRSYRRVFDLERRVYSVERLRLNPGGVPVRGIIYLLAAVGVMLVLGAAPAVGPVIGVLPWYLRDLALPAVAAAASTLVRIDGRTAHVTAAAMIRRRLRPRMLARLVAPSHAGTVWRPATLIMLPDGSEHVFRRLRYEGPGAVLLVRAHQRDARAERERVGVGSWRSRTVRVRGSGEEAVTPGRRTVLVLRARARLEVLGERPRV